MLTTNPRYVTLGYGEFYPVVYTAKAFVCVYMGAFVGIVSASIPEVGNSLSSKGPSSPTKVISILAAKPKYNTAYEPEDCPFIVVCRQAFI